MGFHKNLRGLDLHAPTNELVENNSGADIAALSVVTLDNMGNVYPQVILAQTTLKHNFGVAGNTIIDGSNGYVTTLGFLPNIDTSPWTEGTILYSSLSGQLSSAIFGKPVALVVKQDSVYGELYVLAATTFSLPIDYWTINGNEGIDPNINFIGTLDNNPVKIRTNNNPVAQFDVNGRFAIGAHDPNSSLHIKSYPGYPGSGLQLDTFSLTTSSTSPTSAYAVSIANNSVVRIKFQVTARESNGASRASFTRSGLFYRHGGNVQVQGGIWQSDFTIMSTSGFQVSYQLGVNDVTFNVKPVTSSDTYWVGHVEIEALANSV